MDKTKRIAPVAGVNPAPEFTRTNHSGHTTPERATELEAAALVWDALAADEQRARDLGLSSVLSASLAREHTYKRTAEAFRIEIQTGEAVCSCCHKPFGRDLEGY